MVLVSVIKEAVVVISVMIVVVVLVVVALRTRIQRYHSNQV